MNASVVASDPSAANRASWYTPGLTDGLGDRLLMFDNTASSSLELLRFRRVFGDHPSFEAELRRRVEQLRHFMHPALTRIRAVDSLGDGAGLALISNYVDGKRLVDVLHDARGASFATSLIQQIVPALVDLHSQGDDVAHGAISPERIVVTPEGGLVLAEHVLGSAIASLQWPSHRLRSELGIPVSASSTTLLDGRNDVMQLAFVALSLLLGRRVDPTAYPASVEHLLDVAGAGPRGSSPSTQLRRWIERALQLTDDPFSTSEEALAALDDVSRARLLVAPAAPRSIPIPEEHVRALQARFRTDDAPARRSATLVEFPAAAAVVETPRAEAPVTPVAPPPRQSRAVIMAGMAVVIAFASFVIGQQVGRPRTTPLAAQTPPVVAAPLPPAATSGSPVAESTTIAAPAPQPAGTPTAATTAPVAAPPTAPPVSAGSEARRSVTPSSPPAPAPFTFGYLSITVPIDLQILLGAESIGATSLPRVMLPAGKHNLLLVNRELGFETTLPVNIPAGKSISASVGVPNGSVSLNALPWANVSVDGRALGTTPLANIEFAIGTHEVVWSHPQFGERTQSITVPVKTPVRLVLDWSK